MALSCKAFLLQKKKRVFVAAADAALDMFLEAGGPVAEAVQGLEFKTQIVCDH
jgi:hypothetical protein